MRVKLKKGERGYLQGCLSERHRELMRRWEVHLSLSRDIFLHPSKIEASTWAMGELEHEMRLLEKTAKKLGLTL